MDGWIKLHRKILKSKVWYGADAEGKVILLTLLLRACHTDTIWELPGEKTAMLKPGQLFISCRRFAISCGTTTHKLRNELKRLEDLKFLTSVAKKEGTIVSICNWGSYQNVETPLGTPLGTPSSAAPGQAGTGLEALSPYLTGTPLGTLKGTLNKKYIYLKNKLNKTAAPDGFMELAAQEPFFIQALAAYSKAFNTSQEKLSPEIVGLLALYAVKTKADWVLKGVNELIAADRQEKIQRPLGYLLGILTNWLKDGLTDDKRGAQQALEDFYREAGVI